MLPETDAETPEPATETGEICTESDTESSAGVQPKPAMEVELELSMSLAAALKSAFQNYIRGEDAVREIVDGILSRRGTSSAPAGEQTALRAAMDELEEDPSDEAGKILNIIFGCFDAVELVREKAFPLKSSVKPTDETPGSLIGKAFGDIARMVPGVLQDDDEKWGSCDVNGDSWEAREYNDQPKRPDCDD